MNLFEIVLSFFVGSFSKSYFAGGHVRVFGLDKCYQLYILPLAWIGVCQNLNKSVTASKNINIHILTQFLLLLRGGIICFDIDILSFSKVCPTMLL